MKSGGILLVIGIILLLIFGVILLRRSVINIPGITGPTNTPIPSPTITPTPSPTTNQNLSTVIENKNNLKLFFAGLKEAGLNTTLGLAGPYTIFAPSDSSIINNLNKLPRDNVNLRSILEYHIVSGSYTSTDLVGRSTLRTLRGDNLVVEINKGNGVTINGASISEPDFKASNGIIHVVNGVLIP